MSNKTITARDLAATLSAQHELTKKKGQEMLVDLVAMITKHRRAHPNQSQQKGSFSRHQRAQNGNLSLI
jgi:hypothetical protein